MHDIMHLQNRMIKYVTWFLLKWDVVNLLAVDHCILCAWWTVQVMRSCCVMKSWSYFPC